MEFDKYSREERALCAHLFRLLHDKLAESPSDSGLMKFLQVISEKDIKWVGETDNFEVKNLKFENAAVISEVAIIRDAYENLKPNVHEFMDRLTEMVMKQENVSRCRLYSQLPGDLCDPEKTHPKQIRWKARYQNIQLSVDEISIYGAIQGMFNAKPDLAITVDKYLISVEIKFTMLFDNVQLKRTNNITDIWASDLLCRDFGFREKPCYAVIRLGASRSYPDISWPEIMEIAACHYPENDRTYIALVNAILLLEKICLEP